MWLPSNAAVAAPRRVRLVPVASHDTAESALPSSDRIHRVAVIGGGPAGLLAAQRLSSAGLRVDVYERMSTVGRKFLIAGRGGLNLTHSEPFQRFTTRYGGTVEMADFLERFGPEELRQWAGDLGVETFVGSSRRVFPKPPLMDRAAPVLRRWLAQLQESGVTIHTSRTWIGFDTDSDRCPLPLLIKDGDGEVSRVVADAVLLALGGASWARLGSDGKWVKLLEERSVAVTRLQPNNVGFQVPWETVYREQYAGVPIKDVRLSFDGSESAGDLMITRWGIEGGAVCALSSKLRDHQLESGRPAVLNVDLKPSMTEAALAARLGRPNLGKASLSSRLRKAARLPPVASGLVRHAFRGDPTELRDAAFLAALLKRVPLELGAHQGFDDAISTSGGVSASGLATAQDADGSQSLMLDALPGVFVAGEMLDWEAPTGGYLLTGCFSTGFSAANQMIRWMGVPM